MILGVDPGERRYGVAIADESTRFARPLEVIDAQRADPVARIGEIVRAFSVKEIVVGRPVSLSGRSGPAVAARAEFVVRLRSTVEATIHEFDERLSTVVAEQGLRAAGGSRRARRAIVDAVAAQVMLQNYLDAKA
jgi:putative holliday junction resolvase